MNELMNNMEMKQSITVRFMRRYILIRFNATDVTETN